MAALQPPRTTTLQLPLCGPFTSTNPITSDSDTDEPFVTPVNECADGVSSERDRHGAVGSHVLLSLTLTLPPCHPPHHPSFSEPGYPHAFVQGTVSVCLLSRLRVLYVDPEDIGDLGLGERALPLTSSLTV